MQKCTDNKADFASFLYIFSLSVFIVLFLSKQFIDIIVQWMMSQMYGCCLKYANTFSNNGCYFSCNY